MTRYRIEEDDDTPDFIIFIEIVLGLLFLPIGLIILIVKIYHYFSEKSDEKALRKTSIKSSKAQELITLASLRDSGAITNDEFNEKKQEILKDL